MRRLPVFLILGGLAALALAGCGGGGSGGKAEAATGILQAGGAKGVQYDTPTQSGTTDANGTFGYLPGETVAFSIGGVQLGAVPGTAKISLFTLAGLTPPASERVLRRELERATRRPTPLVRAMNLARLLIALDADNNPDNGIDVSGRAADLAGKQIDLGLGLSGFTEKLDRLAPNMTRNIPTARTLVFAYQASNLTVATHGPVRYDNIPAVSFQHGSTIAYLPNGARSREDSLPDVLGLSGSSTTYSYDALGRLTGRRSGSQLDPAARVLGSSTSASTYDVRGNLVETVIEQQFFGVPASRTVNSGSADARGLFPEKTFTVDTDGDGDVDSRQVTQTTFDARGNPVSSSTSFDDDNNGAIDSRYAFTDTFDANDHPRTEIFDSDSNADGVIDLRALTTYTQENPRSLVRVTTQDEGVDGVIDDRSTTRWRYDAAGNNTSIVFLDERGPEFTVYGTGEFTMTYDGDNRLLTEVRATSQRRPRGRPAAQFHRSRSSTTNMVPMANARCIAFIPMSKETAASTSRVRRRSPTRNSVMAY
jgi:hypothetical protein